MRNRFYHPTLNRFLQADPIGFAGDPNNMYRHCGNDPINGSDPSGMVEVKKQNEAMGGVGGEATTERVTITGAPVDFDRDSHGFTEVTARNGGLEFLNQGGGLN